MSDPSPLLDTLLAACPLPCPDLTTFRAATAADREAGSPFDRAVAAAARADRLGYAFAAGYDGALHALFRALPATHAACLCVTEEQGNHPRVIHARLDPEGAGFRLHGEKRWATLAAEGDTLYVAARLGEVAGKIDLRVAAVPARAPGVRLTALPPTPFVPEIPHYAVSFDGVYVPALLPGDGWTDHVKPFRTVEDTFVSAATCAWLLTVARTYRWPAELPTRLLALILALREVAAAPPQAPSAHLALAGCMSALDAITTVAEPYWAQTDPELAARWQRDRPILGVARKAREARLANALAALASP